MSLMYCLQKKSFNVTNNLVKLLCQEVVSFLLAVVVRRLCLGGLHDGCGSGAGGIKSVLVI